MSTVVTTPPPPVEASSESRPRGRRTALLILAGFVLLCLVRVISGPDAPYEISLLDERSIQIAGWGEPPVQAAVAA